MNAKRLHSVMAAGATPALLAVMLVALVGSATAAGERHMLQTTPSQCVKGPYPCAYFTVEAVDGYAPPSPDGSGHPCSDDCDCDGDRKCNGEGFCEGISRPEGYCSSPNFLANETGVAASARCTSVCQCDGLRVCNSNGSNCQGTARPAGWCTSPLYYADELAFGPCQTDCNCDGARTCNGIGRCVGDARPAGFCNNPGFLVDEAFNRLGKNKCGSDCECDGNRRCTGGFCGVDPSRSYGDCIGANYTMVADLNLAEAANPTGTSNPCKRPFDSCDCDGARICNSRGFCEGKARQIAGISAVPYPTLAQPSPVPESVITIVAPPSDGGNKTPIGLVLGVIIGALGLVAVSIAAWVLRKRRLYTRDMQTEFQKDAKDGMHF